MTSAHSIPLSRMLVVAATAAATMHAGASTTIVYKCFDRNLGVLYTDQPCRGQQLEIRAGDPDAVAVAALQKERDALAKSIADRIADSRKPRRDAEDERTWVLPPAPAPAYAAYDVYDPAWYRFAPNDPPRRGRDEAARDERRERVGYVPNPLPPRSPPRR